MRFLTRRSILLTTSTPSFAPLNSRLEFNLRRSLLPDWLAPKERSLLHEILFDDRSNSSNNNSNKDIVSLRDPSFRDTFLECFDQRQPQIIMIGDATHGSQELYQVRNELTKTLIDNHSIDAVLCEGDVGAFQRMDAGSNKMMMTDGSSDPGDVDGHTRRFDDRMSFHHQQSNYHRYPRWLWCNDPMREFVSWLRSYNERQQQQQQQQLGSTTSATSAAVRLMGLDIFGLFESMDGVLEYLKSHGSSLAFDTVTQCYKTLQRFRPEPKTYGTALFNNIVESQEYNVKRALKVVEQSEKKSTSTQLQEEELFHALQNARAVVAGESYFRKTASGQVAERWNLRDVAFLENIRYTLAFLEKQREKEGRPVRVVVWAHNTHVGDARATDQVTRGYTNLCRLCRESFGEDSVFSIGMTTFQGSVRASKEWGAPDAAMKLPPAFEGSHEYLLHTVAKRCKENAVGLYLTDNGENRNVALHELFDMDRVERFVGASYSPETELRSHYNVCNLCHQFDYVVHVDSTTALRVESATRGDRVGKKAGTLEDTVPSQWESMLMDEYGGSVTYEDLFLKKPSTVRFSSCR